MNKPGTQCERTNGYKQAIVLIIFATVYINTQSDQYGWFFHNLIFWINRLQLYHSLVADWWRWKGELSDGAQDENEPHEEENQAYDT